MSTTNAWVVVGTGDTPNGRQWRLRVRLSEASDVQVEVEVADDAGWFDVLDQAQASITQDPRVDRLRGGMTGGGYRNAGLPPDSLVKISLIAQGEQQQHIVGEVAPLVAQVRLRLDDGSEHRAKVIRTYVVEHDYFLAFDWGNAEVTAVTALDGQGRVLAKDSRSEESIRGYQEFRRKLHQRRSE